MAELPLPQDGRNFWMLPQGPEDGGYYNYGYPINGRAQYCDTRLMNVILMVGFKWAEMDERRFGAGNTSLPNGESFPPHSGHQNGLQVDVRALRKDGKNLPVNYKDNNYDRDGTARLINCFFDTGLVSIVYFNDLQIARVRHLPKHDDHFHVEVRK